MTNKNENAAEGNSAAKTKDAEVASNSGYDYSTFANLVFLCDAFQYGGVSC